MTRPELAEVLRAQARSLLALADALEAAPATTAPAPLLQQQELAAALGVSVDLLRKLKPPPPHVMVGSARRYELAAVRAWLDSAHHDQTPPNVVALSRRKAPGGAR